MSTLTDASHSRRSAIRDRLRREQLTPDLLLGIGLAVAFGAITFITTGGNGLAANTWTEIALVLIGAGLAVTVLLIGAPGRLWGAVTVALFALLAVLTAASISWSVAPDSSWTEAGRTLSYLAVFGGGAVLARLWPQRWAAVLGAIAALATGISAYALLVKVFPATLDAGDPFGRLRAPFDYWNATGLMAALGLAPCLWAGTRPERGRLTRALAVPALVVLITVIVLSFSRGALLVAVVAAAVWFVIVPLRLRGALVLGLGMAGSAVTVGFALHTHALTHDQVALGSRTSAGHTFGVVLLLTLAVSTLAGLAAAYALDRITLSEWVRRRIAVVLLCGAALLPVAGVAALATSSRGLTGEVSHLFSKLTNTNSGAANTPGRLVELGNTRGRYWSEGLKVGEHALLKGVGALGYGTAVTRYTTDQQVVPHAHSFVIQTFADFGLIGVAVMLALLVAWVLATRRSLAATGAPGRSAERAGLLTLLTVVITFGAHSAVDWTWFVPGTALPALLCAGWLAGRGPDREGIGRVARRRLIDSPGLSAAVIGIAAITLLCAWAMWQPLRASDANAAAITAFASGETKAAISDARTAVAEDPVTVDPLLQLAAIYTALGEDRNAFNALASAVRRQPENPQTWLALGQFDLSRHQPALALSPLQRAQQLDLGSPQAIASLAQARAQLGR